MWGQIRRDGKRENKTGRRVAINSPWELKERQGTPWKIIAGKVKALWEEEKGIPWELKEFMKLTGTSMKAE